MTAPRADADTREPTLHIERNGNWYVERPHATGSDIGPAGYARRGERLPDADVQVQIDYYTRAGFRIDDERAPIPAWNAYRQNPEYIAAMRAIDWPAGSAQFVRAAACIEARYRPL